MSKKLTLNEVQEIAADLPRIEEAVGRPLSEFGPNCHAISLRLVQSGLFGDRARVARGWGKGVASQHSWICPNGDTHNPRALIVDPTLHVYDPAVEGIWAGRNLERHRPHQYGNIWQHGRPAYPTGPLIPVAEELITENMRYWFELLRVPGLDRLGWHVLAHSPYSDADKWPLPDFLTAMDQTPGLNHLPPVDIVGMLTDLNPGGLYF